MFFWNSLAFSMIQQILTIWSLVPLPFLNPAWTSGSSWYHILLKPRMQDFKHDLTIMGDECNCPLVSTFFGIALLGNWDEDWPFPDVQAGFRKGIGTRNEIANTCWIIEKEREFQKNIYLCFIDYAKAFVWIMANCGKLLPLLLLSRFPLCDPIDGSPPGSPVPGILQARTLERVAISFSSCLSEQCFQMA